MMRLRRGTGMACMCPSCHKPSRLASYIIYGSALDKITGGNQGLEIAWEIRGLSVYPQCLIRGRAKIRVGIIRTKTSLRGTETLRVLLLHHTALRIPSTARHAYLDAENSHVNPQKFPLVVMVVFLPDSNGLMVAGGGNAGDESALHAAGVPKHR